MFHNKKQHHSDILRGLKIDIPDVFLEWGIDVQKTLESINQDTIRKVTNDYYVFDKATMFDNLTCSLGLHFRDGLYLFEFFRSDIMDLTLSYNNYQSVIEKEFGPPTKTFKAKVNDDISGGYDRYEWNFDEKVKIEHYVFERFGLEEHFHIERL